MRVLVTGVTGRLGKWVVRELLEARYEPVIFTRKPVGDAEFAQIQQIIGEFDDLRSCVESLRGQRIDAIIHPAAMKTSTDRPDTDSWKDYSTCGLTMQTNIIGLYNMLQSAVRNDIGIFIQTGSNSATGHSTPRPSGTDFPIRYLPIDEEHPVDVEDSYGFSKYAGELLLDTYSRAYGLQCYAVRAGWNLDAARRKELAPSFNQPVTDLFDVLNPYIAFEDCARAHVCILQKAERKLLPAYAVYYCHADDTLASEPTMEIIQRYRPDLLSRLKSALPGYAPFMSNQKLKDHTGWAPRITWREHI